MVFNAPGGGGTYDPDAGWQENPEAGVNGKAVELPGEAQEYEALELIGTDAVTLLFVPTVMGELPRLGYDGTWAGKVRTVRQVFPIRPAGTALLARVVMA